MLQMKLLEEYGGRRWHLQTGHTNASSKRRRQYQRFLKAISYHNAPEHDELLQWCGGWFDPVWFDLSLIRFGSPQRRWDIAFINEPVPKTLRTVQYHRMRGAAS